MKGASLAEMVYGVGELGSENFVIHESHESESHKSEKPTIAIFSRQIT